MKNPRIQAFKVILQRRERIDGTLRDTLAQQQKVLQEFVRQTEEKKSVLDEHTTERENYDGRIAKCKAKARYWISVSLISTAIIWGWWSSEPKQNGSRLKRLQVVVQRHEGEVGLTRGGSSKTNGKSSYTAAEIPKNKCID